MRCYNGKQVEERERRECQWENWEEQETGEAMKPKCERMEGKVLSVKKLLILLDNSRQTGVCMCVGGQRGAFSASACNHSLIGLRVAI